MKLQQNQHHKLKTKHLENHRKPSPSNSSPQIQNQIFEFHIGSEIEVTSDEEGFKGAWYSATVVEPPSNQEQQERKVYVEYKNLLSDENGSTLLNEFVKVEFVRPKPPIDETDQKRESFEVNDVVDAFYQDGWWSGVVTQLVGKDKYRVLFYSPPDKLEFHFKDLRVHKDWINGNWVLPQKQTMRDLNFSPRTAVEVNIDLDNSCDIWVSATFLEQVANNSFLVEYQESKEAELQKVTVDSLRIRHPPPSSCDKTFNLLEKVDALYESRWVSGVVTKILADGRYIVYFKSTKKEKELSHSDLRFHMEWINGKWTQPSQDTSTKSISEKRVNSSVNGGNKDKTRAASEVSDAVKNNVSSDRISTPNLRSSQKELQMSGNEKTNHHSATPSNKRVKQTSANSDSSHSRPPRRTNEEPASDVALSHDSCKSKTKHVEASNHGTPADLDSPTSGHLVQSDMKQSEDSSQPSDPAEVKDDHEKLSASRKRGRPQRVRGLTSGDALETDVKTPSKSDAVKPPFGPIVVGLTHNGKMIDVCGNTSSQHLKLEHKKAVEGEENSVDDHESIVSNESEQQKEGEVTNPKRKSGRPKDSIRVGSPKTNETVCSEQEKKNDASDAKDDVERESPISEVEKPIAVVEPSGISNSVPDLHKRRVMKVNDPMKRRSDIHRHSMRSTSRKQIRKRKVPIESVMHDLSEPVKKGKKQKSSKQVETQSEDAVHNSRIRAIEVFSDGIDRAVARTSSNASDDDRPLSAWFEGAVFPIATDFRIPLHGTAGQSDGSAEREEIKTALVVDQVKDRDALEYVSAENVQVQDRNAAGRPDEMAIQSQSTAIVPMEERDLPFVKNSLIWQLIENMEVLKRIPQKPHFRPLYNCKEECREGLAIGSMVTFTSLVERISKSNFSDSISLLDGYLEALVDLEELGFNVSPVREQLNKLISLKGKSEQAQNTAKEIESQIMERNLEKSTINAEMADLDRKLAELMEKRAIVVSKKERKEAEIALLQSSIDAINGTLEDAENEFETITSTLW